MRKLSKIGTLPVAKRNKQKLSEMWLLTMEPLKNLKKSYKITQWKMKLKGGLPARMTS